MHHWLRNQGIKVFQDYLQSKVLEPHRDYPQLAVQIALSAFAVVGLIETTAAVLLYIFIFVPDTVRVTQVAVNASLAGAGMSKCSRWEDSTQYGTGLPLPQFSDIADFYVVAAPNGSRPILGDEFFYWAQQLSCVAPDLPATAASGATAALVEDWYDARFAVGKYQVPCKHPDVPQLYAYNLGLSFELGCHFAAGRMRQLFYSLERDFLNATDTPALWGVNCKVKNGAPRHIFMGFWWHWPEQPQRPGFSSSFSIWCDGALGVRTDFQGLYNRSITADEKNTLETQGMLCTESYKGQCLVMYIKQRWGAGTEYARVTLNKLDCTDTWGVPLPEAALALCRTASANHTTPFYQQLTDASVRVEDRLAGDTWLVATAMQTLIANPDASIAPNIGLFPRNCPSRTSSLIEILNRSSLNFKNLRTIASEYDMLNMFTYQCSEATPPTFSQHFSAIWPYLSIVHTVAMTYAVRYIYVGLVKGKQLIDKNKAEEAQLLGFAGVVEEDELGVPEEETHLDLDPGLQVTPRSSSVTRKALETDLEESRRSGHEEEVPAEGPPAFTMIVVPTHREYWDYDNSVPLGRRTAEAEDLGREGLPTCPPKTTAWSLAGNRRAESKDTASSTDQRNLPQATRDFLRTMDYVAPKPVQSRSSK